MSLRRPSAPAAPVASPPATSASTRLDHVLRLGAMQKNRQGSSVGVSALDTQKLFGPEARKKEAVLKEMAYKYESMRLTTFSGKWVTPKVFDVSFHVEVMLKKPVEGDLVKTIKHAVVVGFLAEDGKKTPAVMMQKRNVGEDFYDYDSATKTVGQRNELIRDLEDKMGTIVFNAAKLFKEALLEKYPNLELVKTEPGFKEMGYIVRVRGGDDMIR